MNVSILFLTMWEDTARTIVEWLKNEMHNANSRGYVFGLSGGLDSAVCAALLKKATDNCLGLILPIETSVVECDDAAEVAAQLTVQTEYIDVTTLYHNLTRLLPGDNQVALGNIKARLRMVVLYYYANVNNYLVCGTGNKTELSIGYFTKHGDGACDVLPIGDLYKHEVRQLASVLDILEKIINKVPSAGLWQEQTDESEIGFCYDDIDKALQAINNGTVDGECAQALKTMIDQTEHKRRLPRICLLKNKV